MAAIRLVLGKLFAVIILLFLWGCSTHETAPEPFVPTALDSLFAPPIESEIQQVQQWWSDSSWAATQVQEIFADTLLHDSEAVQIAHIIAYGPPEFQQLGAVIIPHGKTVKRILHYGHSGDVGVTLEEVQFLFQWLPSLWKESVILVSPYRSESLTWGDSAWLSQGVASPWVGDVLDALRLRSAADSLQFLPAHLPQACVGFSRGAGVCLLMAEQDEQISKVVDFFGPTDFLGEHVRRVADSLLQGKSIDLPGLDVLENEVLLPWSKGDLSLPEARLALLRRSALYFTDHLQSVQIHHGTADTIVYKSHSDSLANRLGNGAQYLEYPGVGHNPLGMISNLPLVEQFLQ